MKKEILDFFSDGCGNCKMMEPYLVQIESEFSDITITRLNIKDAQDKVEKYDVTTLPTLVFLKDDEPVATMVGLKPKSLIVKKINEVLV